MIGAIVAVATIGGFMFGYDSGVINGTQEGLEKAFKLSAFGTGGEEHRHCACPDIRNLSPTEG